MIRQAHRAVQHAGRPQVVDVGLVAEREIEALIAAAARADTAERLQLGSLALREELDRVEDLDVTGAAAQVRAQVAGRGVAVEIGALALEQRRHAHEYPRRAEAALQRARRRERRRHAFALGVRQPLEGRHSRAGHLLYREIAADDRLAVDEHRATPALSRGRTAVLGRAHSELFA